MDSIIILWILDVQLALDSYIWDGSGMDQFRTKTFQKPQAKPQNQKSSTAYKLNSTEQNSHLHLGKPESILFYSVHQGHSKGCEPVS